MAAEKNFENRLKKFLKDKGCWVLKTWGGGLQRSGIPDLLVCYKGLFIAIELKAPKGKPSDLQMWNLSKIHDAGGFAWLLYPDKFEEFKEFISTIETFDVEKTIEIYRKFRGW